MGEILNINYTGRVSDNAYCLMYANSIIFTRTPAHLIR